MKLMSLAFIGLIASAANADTYYCQLENVPQVKVALEKALKLVDAEANQVKPTGEITHVTLASMGDAFDLWGTDLLIYKLDGMANDNARVVGVKASYIAVMAEAYKTETPDAEDIICADTGEVNAALVYINGENANGEAIKADPFEF